MSAALYFARKRGGLLLLALLTCIGLFAQPAEAQRMGRHRRHRVVITRRVRRHGHWVTIRQVVYR